jgi:hypothetical protein
MTLTSSPDSDVPTGTVACWCCGTSPGQDRLVHLHAHPEVTLCLSCARWLSKSAGELEDRTRTGFAARVRGWRRRARRFVMDHGWHDRRIIGRPLRWIGKHTP